MINAKLELLEHIGDKKVEFVKLVINKDYWGEPIRIKGPLDEILTLLDFEYDNGFGAQMLFGYIWYCDGTWSERGEYGGSEWWVHKFRPDPDADMTPEQLAKGGLRDLITAAKLSSTG